MKAIPVWTMDRTYGRLMAFFVAIFFLAGTAGAQEKILSGYLKDSITLNPISGGTISNRDTRIIAETGLSGFFTIKVRPGDLLVFSANGYKMDTLRYFMNIADTINVELRPELKDSLNVTVRSYHYTKYQQDSLQRRLAFIEDAGPKAKAFANGNSGAGVGLNLDALFKKKDRQVRENYKRFEEREKELYIDSRFSAEMVQYYTRLKGDSLVVFMRENRPDYDWLREHTRQEDMLLYLNDRLKLFNGKTN